MLLLRCPHLSCLRRIFLGLHLQLYHQHVLSQALQLRLGCPMLPEHGRLKLWFRLHRASRLCCVCTSALLHLRCWARTAERATAWQLCMQARLWKGCACLLCMHTGICKQSTYACSSWQEYRRRIKPSMRAKWGVRFCATTAASKQGLSCANQRWGLSWAAQWWGLSQAACK